MLLLFFHSKKDPDLLVKVIPCLQHLLQDENVNVQKKVIFTLSSIYKTLLLVSPDFIRCVYSQA